MTTSATFENAVLADAVNKAARIAPSKGAAFDKCAGIIMNVSIQENTCHVRSTDIDTTFEQRIPLVEGKGVDTTWRIPSALLQSLISTLPTNEGDSTSFIDQGDGSIRLKAGRTIAKLNMLDVASYPQMAFTWEDSVDFVEAQDLAFKVEQVAWACDRKSHVLSGVYVNGTELIGCDSHVMACIPAKVNLKEPVIVPLSTLSVVLKSASDCRVSTSDKRLQIALDDATRTTTSLIEGKYPDVKRIMRDDFLGKLKVHRQFFVDTLNRMMVLSKTEKMPTLRLEISGAGLVPMITFDMEITGVGRMQDSMDITTDFADVFEISFHPRMIQQAMESTRGDYVEIFFGSEKRKEHSHMMAIEIRDTRGFRCYVSPKVVNK